MRDKSFQETRRKQRFSIRKFNVGVASVLLGVTVFGIDLGKNHKIVSAATMQERITPDESNTTIEDGQATTTLAASSGTDTEESKTEDANITGSGGTTKAKDKTSSTDGKAADSKLDSEPKIDDLTGEKLTKDLETAVKAPDKVEVADPSKLTDDEKEKVKSAIEAVNPDIEFDNIIVNADGSASVTLKSGEIISIASSVTKKTDSKSKLPKSDQTVSKVTDPMYADFEEHNHKGEMSWINYTIKNDFPQKGNADSAIINIFGDEGIIKTNSEKYFFAGYVDYTESIHRTILFARGQNSDDDKLYVYVYHAYNMTWDKQVVAPGEDSPEIEYDHSTYNLKVHNYGGESFTVSLEGYNPKKTHGYGLIPIFDQGMVNPKYADILYSDDQDFDNSFDALDEINKSESIGTWASVIPHKTQTSIRYVDKETGEDIAQPVIIEGYGYQGYKVQGEPPTIDGYNLVNKPQFLKSEFEDGVIGPYQIGGTYTQYLTADIAVKQTVLDANGTVRATVYYQGKPLESVGSKILGHTSDNEKWSFYIDGTNYTYTNLVNHVADSMVYYYSKVGHENQTQLRVHYIDVTKDLINTEYAPGDGVEVGDVNTITGDVGETYDLSTLTGNIPSGYIFTGKTSTNLDGKYSFDAGHDAYIYVKIDRDSAKKKIQDLKNLNQAQKDVAKVKVDNATDLAGMNAEVTAATTLDTHMGQLFNDAKTVETSNNYKYASEGEAKEAVKADFTIVDGLKDTTEHTGLDATNDQVLAYIDKLQADAKLLDGDANFTNATNTITGLQNLNKGQKDAALADLSSANNLTELNNKVVVAKTLDDKMADLKAVENTANAAKAEKNYYLASDDKYSRFNEALKAVQAVTASDSLINAQSAKITELKSALENALKALDGDTNYKDAKNHINGLQNISEPQRAAELKSLDGATNYLEVQSVIADADKVDVAMKAMRAEVALYDEVIKTQNYKFADNKDAYNTVINQAKKNIPTNPSLFVSNLEDATNRIKNRRLALNGQAKIDEANETLKGLTNLNQNQWNTAKTQVDQATDYTTLKAAIDSATALNTLMGTLATTADAADTKSVDYYDATPANKDALDDAIENANKVLDFTNGEAKNSQDVQALIEAITAAQGKLDGQTNLDSTNATIDKLANLNQNQKNAAKTQATGAKKYDELEAAIKNATDLDTIMGTLADTVDNADTKSPNYTEATSTNKKALDNAIADANKVLDPTNGAAKNSTEVQAMIDAITNAQKALDGNTNVATAKQKAIDAINNDMTNLSDVQKQNAIASVNGANTIAGVTSAKDAASSLNDAVGQLKGLIDSAEKQKNTPNYTEADNKTAFDTALDNANTAKNSNTLADITAAINELSGALSDLNGQKKLDDAKAEANTEIGKMANLSDVQKQNATTNVNTAQTIAGVTTAKDNASKLNDAVGQLKSLIAEAEKQKNTPNYTETDNKAAFDTALNNANSAKDSNAIADVNSAINELTGALSDLNGQKKLDNAKAEANTAIGKMTSLSDDQKQNAIASVNGANTIADVTTAKDAASSLNDAVGQLQEAIQSANDEKQKPNYTEADGDKQKTFDDEINRADGIAKNSNDINEVKQEIATLDTAKGNLNGDAKVKDAKDKANAAIDGMTNLSGDQKQNAKDTVENATTISGVNDAKNNASSLNDAVGKLQEAIDKANAEKKLPNYTDASDQTKKAFDDALNKANQAKDSNDIAEVTKATDALNSAVTNLDGNHNVENAKKDAKDAIDKMDNLSDSQKQHAKNAVDQATTKDGVDNANNAASDLADAIGELNNVINDANKEKATPNYTEADKDKQNALGGEIAKAEGIAQNSDDIDEVRKEITDLTDAKNGLNGNTNVENAKKDANAAIDGMTNLSDSQKQSAKDNVEKATTISGVTDAKNNASGLNDVVGDLKNLINSAEEEKKTPNYTEADGDKQNALNDEIAKAERIAKGSNDINEVKQEITDLNTAKGNLNGDANVEKAKAAANDAIDHMANLSDGQKQNAKSNVEKATTISGVTDAKNNASSLNDAVGKLNEAINKATDEQTKPNYTEASDQAKDALDTALKNGQDAKTSNDITEITKATDDLNKAIENLDGNNNVDNAKKQAKDDIDKMDDLSPEQKQHAKDAIDQATTKDGVDNAKKAADDLAKAISDLNNAINDANAEKQKPNYTEADGDKQKNFDDEIAKAQDIAKNSNDADKVRQEIDDLTKAKSGLNGDDNVDKARTDAKSAINQMTNLSDGQKQNAKDNVDKATTISGVTDAKNNASSLNDAAGKLQEAIDNATKAKTTTAYTEASDQKRDALNEALKNGQDAKNSNDIDQVTKATQDLIDAQGQLDGDQNLTDAKNKAKDAIDHMDSLSPDQKKHAQDAVDQATNTDGVDKAKQEADDLAKAINELNKAIDTANAEKKTPNYTDASDKAKGDLDDALDKGNQAKNSNDIAEVKKATDDLNEAIKNLDGNSNVEDAKKKAKDDIDKMDNLSLDQKQHAKDAVDQATTKDGVDKSKKAADDLNKAIAELKQAINDANKAKKTPNYGYADVDKKKALDNALTYGENVLNSNDILVVKNATTSLRDAINNLNGDRNWAQMQADEANNSTTDMSLIVPGTSQAPKTVDGIYMHSAIGYTKQGKATKIRHKSYDSIKYIPKVVKIKGRSYYKLADKDEYILTTNVTGRKRRLKRNAYIYNAKGERIAIFKKLKKGKEVTTYGKSFIFKNGKKYYRIGKGQYIRVINFVAPKKK